MLYRSHEHLSGCHWPIAAMKTKLFFTAFVIFAIPFAAFPQEFSKDQALRALHKAASFYRNETGYQGAYVYRVSADLKLREGEGKASVTGGWIEPPGTAYVGAAYLEAWRLTGEQFLLDAALEVADALRKTQLESGGWSDSIELGEGRAKYCYRLGDSKDKAHNHSTLDDNKTQSCLRFLMHLDEQLKFKNKDVRDTLDYAFEKSLAAQYPNGAWPQKFTGPPASGKFPVLKARYPEAWPREYPKKDYRGYYTFNDGSIVDMMNVMLEAWQIYGDNRFLDSAVKTGDFFLLAQMPDPQPGWAQQYHPDMTPAWARKFEPASISGGESQGVMVGLLSICQATGDKKYLEPLPRALQYYRTCLRSDGNLARFYELQTNKPLYFTKGYKLTYSDSDMPTHYGFVVGSKLDRIEKQYLKLKDTPPDKLKPVRKFATYKKSKSLMENAQKAAEALDQRGAWVEKGSMKNYEGVEFVIESKTFSKRLADLAKYISTF